MRHQVRFIHAACLKQVEKEYAEIKHQTLLKYSSVDKLADMGLTRARKSYGRKWKTECIGTGQADDVVLV